jgi:hypothetical protein
MSEFAQRFDVRGTSSAHISVPESPLENTAEYAWEGV